MYLNVEKNHHRKGYHGWDGSGRYWHVNKSRRDLWIANLRDGTEQLIGATLREISDKLARTFDPKPNRPSLEDVMRAD